MIVPGATQDDVEMGPADSLVTSPKYVESIKLLRCLSTQAGIRCSDILELLELEGLSSQSAHLIGEDREGTRSIEDVARGMATLEDKPYEKFASLLRSIQHSDPINRPPLYCAARQKLEKFIGGRKVAFADNNARKVLDCLHLASIQFLIIKVLYTNVCQLDYDHDILALSIILTIFWFVDIFLRTQTAVIGPNRKFEVDTWKIVQAIKWDLAIDVIAAFPLDIILMFAVPHTYPPYLAARLLKLIKIFRVPKLLVLVNTNFLTHSSVVFFFRVRSIIMGFFRVISITHLLACTHILCRERSGVSWSYSQSLYTVIGLATGGSVSLEIDSLAEDIFVAFLLFFSVFFLGAVVGKLSMLVFENNIESDHYRAMRDTLDIVKRYNIPAPLQREILSFQSHMLSSDASQLFGNFDTLPAEMQREIALYIKKKAMMKVPLFSEMPRECVEFLAERLTTVIVEADVDVVKFGDIGNEMFIILHGFVDVVIESGVVVATLSKGEHFGEIALLQQNCRRMATVQALTYCELWKLDKSSFLEAVAKFPKMLEIMKERMPHKNIDVEAIFRDAQKRIADQKGPDDKTDAAAAAAGAPKEATPAPQKDDNAVVHSLKPRESRILMSKGGPLKRDVNLLTAGSALEVKLRRNSVLHRRITELTQPSESSGGQRRKHKHHLNNVLEEIKKCQDLMQSIRAQAPQPQAMAPQTQAQATKATIH